uniref:Uncharacterized protein n=1 Tax=Globisporangium ultimum (strain ATCC 200006 / CBS 805.95 / DAOM BR144) TaxID=431595 RepID=K3WUT4_GLOUD
MASTSPSPAAPFQMQSTSWIGSDNHAQQHEDGRQDTVCVREIEKLRSGSQEEDDTTLRPEDNNQDDNEKILVEREQGASDEQQVEQQNSELTKLKQENQSLTQQLKDLGVQYARHVRTLQAELQQSAVAHEQSEQELKRQITQLQKVHHDTVDNARRAQAQANLLRERVCQAEASSGNISPPQYVPAPLPRHVGPSQREPNYAPPPSPYPPHAVQRSMVPPVPSSHFTCHPPTGIPTGPSTVKVTRLGRNHSAPPGSVGVAQPVRQMNSSPPVNPFQWREDVMHDSHVHGYQAYNQSSPPRAPISASEPYQSTAPHFCQPPSGYFQPPQACLVQLSGQPQTVLPVGPGLPPTTSLSVCPLPDEASTSPNQSPDRQPLEKKASGGGILAYCSDLITSSLTPAASASKVMPAWNLFGNPTLSSQTSLDVEQGFSPPHHHQTRFGESFSPAAAIPAPPIGSGAELYGHSGNYIHTQPSHQVHPAPVVADPRSSGLPSYSPGSF